MNANVSNGGNGYCYQYNSATSLWPAAETACTTTARSGENGHLASIHDINEMTVTH